MTSNKRIEVLDKGYVELLLTMPEKDLDSHVVQMARTSYMGHTKGYDADMKLLRYLVQNKHLAPFEHVHLTFKVKAPLFVARQWFRHRMASYSEASLRYTEAEETDYYTPSEWRIQSRDNKQSSHGVLEDSDAMNAYYQYEVKSQFRLYEYLLSQGVTREQARMILPASLYTTFIYTTDLRNLVWSFLEQRTDEHSQWEIRQFANAIKSIVTELAPKTMEYYEEFHNGQNP